MLNWLVSTDGGLSLAPAVFAIALALLTRRVEIALALGIVVGGFVAAHGAPADAVGRIVGYAGASLGWSDGAFSIDHLEISVFSLIVAATVGVMGASGGTRGVIHTIERFANGRRGAMLSTWFGGMLVFFDDYANCLVVGSAMGPLADRYGVSRQKLAYIVDSTAAPIASLAIVSTWVGYEVGLIADQLPPDGPNAFSVFLASVPYRFYSVFTIVFVGAIAMSGRDFGPMWEAEAAARPHEAESTDTAPVGSPLLAAIPVGLLIVGTLGWLVTHGWLSVAPVDHAQVVSGLQGARGFTGWIDASASVLGSANAYHAMLFGSVLAFVTATTGAILGSPVPNSSLPRVAFDGARQVGEALVVLFLAWGLSEAMGDTGASTALTGVLNGAIPAWSLPTTTFVLAAATAFATGTSFGTMGILIPIAVPVVLQLAPGDLDLLYATTAGVLAGSCLGDHASPISDTTILSAVGAGTSLVEHVRTQAPYALTTGAIAIFAGYLPVGLGVSVWICLPIGAALAVAVVWGVGRPVPTPSVRPDQETGVGGRAST